MESRDRERLKRIERDVTTTNELLRQLVEVLHGIESNQRGMADNQTLIIEALGRLADRLSTESKISRPGA